MPKLALGYLANEFIQQAAKYNLSVQEWETKFVNGTVRFAHENTDFLVLMPDPNNIEYVFMQVPLEHAVLCETYVDVLENSVTHVHLNDMLANRLVNVLLDITT